MVRYSIKGYGKTISQDVITHITNKKMLLSVIIPTFNEEGNVLKLTHKIKEVLDKTNFKSNYEIIVVDDNSTDRTSAIIDKLAEKNNFIALHRLKDKGIFSAVVDGIKLSNGKFVLTMDADFSHPPEIIPKILSHYRNYDIVSASRFIKGGDMESPFIRKIGSKILNRVCGIIMGVSIKDLGGNFRLFNREKFLQLPLKYDSVFGEFGFEIFYRAKKLNYKIKEVPFTYYFRKEGKSKMGNLFKYGAAYLKRAFQLRFES
ncbi:glycosyltransferase [Candidatus Pacearchaeota archaeon]|nr:glycosyltransferase [Candidatus Pacearchaeota archaeon]